MGHSDSSWPISLPRSYSARDTASRGLFAPATVPSGPHRRPGPGLRWTYAVVRSRGRRPPRFLDIPWARAPLFDPDGTPAPDHSAHRCGLPQLSKRRLPRHNLSRLNHAARTLPVYASPRRSLDAAQHSVPDGGQPCPDGPLTRKDAKRISMSTASPSSPGLAWRTIANFRHLRVLPQLIGVVVPSRRFVRSDAAR